MLHRLWGQFKFPILVAVIDLVLKFLDLLCNILIISLILQMDILIATSYYYGFVNKLYLHDFVFTWVLHICNVEPSVNQLLLLETRTLHLDLLGHYFFFCLSSFLTLK